MNKQVLKRPVLLGILIGSLVGIVVFHLHYPSRLPGSNLLWRLELLSYDWRLPSRDRLRDDIVIVAVDTESSVSIQAWPWPRALHAALVDRLTSAGARAIGIDMVFSTVSNSKPTTDWLQEPAPSVDDLKLAKALKRSGRVVLAAALQEIAADQGAMSSSMVSVEFPHWRFEEAAAGVGIANYPKDVDGTIRRMYLRHHYQDETENAFALELLKVAYGDTVAARSALPRTPHLYLPNETVPISFAGPAQTYQTIPFYKALDRRLVTDEAFRGKIVLVGATDALLQDTHPSPMGGAAGRDMPGVEIQANSLATLLSGQTIQPVPLALTMLMTVLCGLLAGGSTAALRPVRALWSTLVPLGAVAVGLPMVLMNQRLIWVPMVAPLMALVLSYAVLTVLMYVAEERARRAVRTAWQRRVAPEILDVILKHPELAQVRGRRVIATVLFSDIRGFTNICDAMEPEQVVVMLNQHLTAMTGIIRQHRGTVHKFLGDGIMAVFGDPLPDECHSDQALRAALAMCNAMQEMSVGNGNSGSARCEIGVGIHSGPMVAGDVGSQEFMEYTVIGSTVNVASRLEGLNKEFATSIIVSEATKDLLTGDYHLQDLGAQEIRGGTQALRIYAVGASDEQIAPTHPNSERRLQS